MDLDLCTESDCYYYYYYYYYKCQDYSSAITQLRGHFTKSISKTVSQFNADVC